MTDCSYFREALGLKITDPIVLNPQDKGNLTRYGCASLTLFQLHDNGNLHPLAIVIDYRASIKDSVVIFNQRLSPSDPTPGESWPWRYAKTCAQSSDWTLHEMTVHLTNTRLIQEAIIVATHRCIPFDNVIYQLLEPHWFRTLSRNAAMRETLVPQIVLDLVAYTQDQAFNFIQHAYHNFDFQGKYVPRTSTTAASRRKTLMVYDSGTAPTLATSTSCGVPSENLFPPWSLCSTSPTLRSQETNASETGAEKSKQMMVVRSIPFPQSPLSSN